MSEVKYTNKVIKLSNQIHRLFYRFSNSSGSQSWILNYLLMNASENICQKDIQKETETRAATTTAVLQRLEEQGLIVRERDPDDERKKRIYPTALAMEKKEEITKELDLVEHKLISGIGEAELDVFQDVIEKMIENMS